MPQEKKKKRAYGAEAVENRREVKRLKRKFDAERKFHVIKRSKAGRSVHARLAEKHEMEILDKMRELNRKTREISRRKK
jgi:hypothetical protein